MSKYLTTGVATIAFIVAFTSCSKTDLYDQGAVDERNRQEQEKKDQQKEMTVNEKYAFAFEKAFGKVGPNVDWGFGRKSSSTRAFTRAKGDYAQYKGNMQPSISFPDDCAASNFLKEVPEGVNKLPTWGGGPGSYYIDAETQSVSTWSGASNIYVTGSVDLSADDTNAEAPRFAPDNRSKIYLLKGATLKLGEVSALNFNVDAIYIAEGATLQSDYSLWANNSTKIYNHGNIIVESFKPNTASFLYNVGTMTAGSVTAESNPSRIVNDGTINCTSVTVKAGAVQNNAEWNVTGTTHINSNNSGWVNNGHWTTYNYAYIGGSENVINNCFLEVEEDFEMNISSETGAFKIDGGGGVLTKNFYGGRDSSTGAVSGPFKINMGANAVFVVEETAQFESGRGDDEGFGIFGVSSDAPAVFQAKNIVRDSYLESIKSHGAVTYGGNLYVSAETHFAQGNDGSKPFIYVKDDFTIADNIYAAGFKSGKPNINISETPCSPGFRGGDPLYRVIAEDLSASEAGDFDFNDVVFDVVKAEGGVTTLKLICAGGVLPLRVRGANQAEGTEIHSLFGERTPNANGQYNMYNTGIGTKMPEAEFTVEGEYTTPEQIRNIIIEVWKNDKWMELKAETGKAACKILVDDTFVPVVERRNIADENQNFTNYVQGKFVNDFWWK
ncbi:MAG: hypothetical protein IKN58_06315 [Prevotella sp.]|nr:hypothetical protein [Prevotella sp.]